MVQEQYVELYKKYRPRKWSQLIGQEATTKTLQLAISSKKFPTAYAFFGPRGCGKTSSAFILAKAVNCEQVDDKSNPCNKCETCRSIDDGTQIGVNYVSMANHGGVEDIRSIVQQARLSQPVKKQIWILDEVHNLSKQAFDALLIPIEESTMPSMFIFCSTEVDKIPATVLSRVQQRSFTLVSPPRMASFLGKINTWENLGLDDTVIAEAVRQGRGSVRDTLSALDMLILGNGESSKQYDTTIFEAVISKQFRKIFVNINDAGTAGVNFKHLTEHLFNAFCDLLLAVSDPDSQEACSKYSEPTFTAAKKIGVKKIVDILGFFGETLNNMAYNSADPKILLEIALIKTVQSLTNKEGI